MERAGCTPDRKAREMLHDASVTMEQMGCKCCICSCPIAFRGYIG
jgi:hypothetical protein